jgi:hypothetical protein
MSKDKRKSSKPKEEPTQKEETVIDMKTVLAASIILQEMHEGIPTDVYRSFRSWEAYGKLADITRQRVKAVLSQNRDGINFEKRLMRAKEFIEYLFDD